MRSGSHITLPRAGTRVYRTFLSELQQALVDDAFNQSEPLLNGRAGLRCRELVPETTRRQLGAYFTPSDMAQSLVEMLTIRSWSETIVLDPACGAGDLLLPVARKLPTLPTVSATVSMWNQHLRGFDISSEFVRATKLRLVLLAASRGARLDGDANELVRLITGIRVADGLRARAVFQECTHVIMNPPFVQVASPKDAAWRSGEVTAAAVFVERAVRLSRKGTEVIVLLPEVLRTGTSYAAWRAHVATLATTDRTRSIGVFSPHANVDVFMQRFIRRQSSVALSQQSKRTSRLGLGHYFTLKVGSVVPYRHPKSGPLWPFLHAGNAAPWAEIKRINEQRRFTGTVFSPPFVVIRRTSRPGDPHRATASLVLGRRKVAVENHLIVAAPRRGGVPLCRKLLRLLASHKTDIQLDRNMRCRHLTLPSIQTLPWNVVQHV